MDRQQPEPRRRYTRPGKAGRTSSLVSQGGISPCCGPPPAAPATREPRPWRRGPRAGAVWLCEERRGWAAAGAPFRGGRGPASASLPAGRRLEAAGLRHHPSSPGRRPAARHVLPQSGLPRPRGRPSWSRAKKQRGAYPRSAPRGHQHRRAGTGTQGPNPLPVRYASRKSAHSSRGNLLLSQSPRWRPAVTYTRSRESEDARLDGAQASASGEQRSACWGLLALGKSGTDKSTGPERLFAVWV